MDKKLGLGLLVVAAVGGVVALVVAVSRSSGSSEYAAPEPRNMPDTSTGRGDSAGDVIAAIGGALGSAAGGAANIIGTVRRQNREDRQQEIDREERAADRAERAAERSGGSNRGR